MNTISKAIRVERKNAPHSLKAFMHTGVQESVKGDDWVVFVNNFQGFVKIMLILLILCSIIYALHFTIESIVWSSWKCSKDEGSSQGFTECSAFQKGLKKSEEKIVSSESTVSSSSFKLNLFRHYTERNIYMIRNGLFFIQMERMELFDGWVFS